MRSCERIPFRVRVTRPHSRRSILRHSSRTSWPQTSVVFKNGLLFYMRVVGVGLLGTRAERSHDHGNTILRLCHPPRGELRSVHSHVLRFLFHEFTFTNGRSLSSTAMN